MNTHTQHLAALQQLGYDDHEARFLYLVATHSGYFTIQQFLDFTGQAKGRPAHRFIQKLISRRHARTTEYARKTYVVNVYSRRVYGAIDKDNLRNRRRQSKDLVLTRLLILDFVLAHATDPYLETEADKVAYFHDVLGLSLPALPGRIYKGVKSNQNTKRYFVDRFPIFISNQQNGLGLQPVVTFTYCDRIAPSLTQYVTHLRAYEEFLRRLPAFNFVYASPNPANFSRARAFFSRVFPDAEAVDARHLARYFQLRLLWESNRTSMLTRADRDFLRAGHKRYQGELFDSAFRTWAARGLSDSDISSLVDRQSRGKKGPFVRMCFLMSTTFSRPLPPDSAERQFSSTVPLTFRSRSVSCDTIVRWGRDLRADEHLDSDAAESTPWPGAPFCAPKPLRALGVAPGHGSPSTKTSLRFLPPHDLTKLWYRTLTNSWYGSRSKDLREPLTRKETKHRCLS